MDKQGTAEPKNQFLFWNVVKKIANCFFSPNMCHVFPFNSKLDVHVRRVEQEKSFLLMKPLVYTIFIK